MPGAARVGLVRRRVSGELVVDDERAPFCRVALLCYLYDALAWHPVASGGTGVSRDVAPDDVPT